MKETVKEGKAKYIKKKYVKFNIIDNFDRSSGWQEGTDHIIMQLMFSTDTASQTSFTQ